MDEFPYAIRADQQKFAQRRAIFVVHMHQGRSLRLRLDGSMCQARTILCDKACFLLFAGPYIGVGNRISSCWIGVLATESEKMV